MNQKLVMFYNNKILKPITKMQKKEVEAKSKQNSDKKIIVLQSTDSIEILKIRNLIFNRMMYCRNIMLEEFISSCELVKKVEYYEELII